MKIKVLLVMPGKEVQIIRIPASIKFIKSFMGGDLYKKSINRNTIIIASKNVSNKDFNRIFRGEIIVGTFFVISTKKGRLTSMRKKNIRRYTNMFLLRKHIKKVNKYQDEYLENYYYKQIKRKEENRKHFREQIFNRKAA